MAKVKKEKVKKPFYKKWWFIALVAFILIGAIGNTVGGGSDSSKPTEPVKIEATTPKATEATTEATTEPVKDANSEIDELKETLKKNESMTWFGDVRNDKTGRWKLSEYASATTQEKLAVDYYKAFFQADDEIHAVINMSTKTTANISKLSEDTLDVTIHEYVSKEEHDANILFSGMVLKEYWVTISTGEIEEIR